MRTILAAILVVVAGGACEARTREVAADSASASRVQTASGLVYKTTAAGSGAMSQRGQRVRIHETLSLADGKVVYSTRDKGTPITFVLGAGQVIAGVDEGVMGMRVGERRALIVPPSLAVRSVTSELIPAGSTLYYDVELVAIVN